MAYAMGRMPQIWGEDAQDFRPERWLKNGVFQPESPFKFLAFHVCFLVSFVVRIFSLSMVLKCFVLWNDDFAGRIEDLSWEGLCLPADEDSFNRPSSLLPVQTS